MALTDAKVRAAKPLDKSYKLTDGDGMHLMVHTNGSKYWRLQYRFGGKQKMLALGVYSSVDIGVNGTIVKRYPIGYWNQQKELSGKKRSRWKEKDRSQGSVKTDMEAYERMTKYGHLSDEEYQKIKQKEKK